MTGPQLTHLEPFPVGTFLKRIERDRDRTWVSLHWTTSAFLMYFCGRLVWLTRKSWNWSLFGSWKVPNWLTFNPVSLGTIPICIWKGRGLKWASCLLCISAFFWYASVFGWYGRAETVGISVFWAGECTCTPKTLSHLFSRQFLYEFWSLEAQFWPPKPCLHQQKFCKRYRVLDLDVVYRVSIAFGS